MDGSMYTKNAVAIVPWRRTDAERRDADRQTDGEGFRRMVT
jgi:hypothetical protein